MTLRSLPSVGAFVLALALLSGVGPVGAQERPAAGPEVVEVRFQGNEAFPDDSLSRAIVNRQTECRTFVFQLFPLCPLGVDWALDRQYLVPREIERDARRLRLYYYRRGYREATVDTSMTRSTDDGDRDVSLTFSIEEGRPVRVDSISFQGVEDVEEGTLLEGLPLERGDPLSGILLDATRDTLEARLKNGGYAHADVIRNLYIPNIIPPGGGEPRPGYSARVTYDVFTGPKARFGEVTIERDSATVQLSEKSLRRMLPFERGDVYSKELLFEAQRNLFNLELVRNVSLQEHLETEPDSVVPITVRVLEGDVHRVRAGAGWSTSDCLNTEALWASRNFLGSARRLQVRGRISNILATSLGDTGCPQSGDGEFAEINWLASVELFQPWLFSTRNSFTVSLFAERQSLPEVFIRRTVGFNAVVTRSLAPRTPLVVSYRPQLSTLDAAEIFFCTSFVVCAPEDINVLQGANWLSPLGATVSHNNTNSFISPSDGYQLRLDLEHASTLTGSDFAYNRVIGEGSWYQELAERTVWAGRLRSGWVSGGEFGELSLGGIEVIHPQKRFYAGGANSVRGFAQNRLGPRVLTTDVENVLGYREGPDEQPRPPACTPGEILTLQCNPESLSDGAFFPRPTGGTRTLEGNLEYRFAFAGRFQGVLFTDVGQVWSEGQDIDLGDLEVSPGLGVRYFSPIGPVRLDVGYRFRGEESLRVITSQIRPFREGVDDPDRRIRVLGPDLEPRAIPWIKGRELALLSDRVLFGDDDGFSLQNLQVHFSIGQAF